MNTKNHEADRSWYIFFPICISLGTGLGATLGNVGLGLALGAAVGTMLNLLVYYTLVGRR